MHPFRTHDDTYDRISKRFPGIQEGDIYLTDQNKYVFDPYNPINVQITDADIQRLLRTYGVDATIHNFHLYRRAFVHRSYMRQAVVERTGSEITLLPKPSDCLPLSTKCNERLEFVGDGVLECITKYYLYRRFPKENEGFMTEKKIALVKNEAIGKIAQDMGLHRWFILSKHAEAKQTRTNLKKLGCLFEAFIGAMFLDFNKLAIQDEDGWFKNLFVTGPGFQMVQVFVEKVFETHVNWQALLQNDDNYKNILQVKIQKEFKVTPDYRELSPYHPETGYHMGVYLCLGQPFHSANYAQALPVSQFGTAGDMHDHLRQHGTLLVLLGEGRHKIKKKAEQTACDKGNLHLPPSTKPSG